MKLLFRNFQGTPCSFDVQTGAVEFVLDDFSNVENVSAKEQDFFGGIRHIRQEDLDASVTPVSSSGDVVHAYFTLSVTEDCSNRCKYCIFGGRYADERPHSKRVLDLEDAIHAVDSFCDDVGSAVCNFSFYGGEPMFGDGFVVVKGVVEHIKNRRDQKLNRFSLTTNGNHFSENAVRFLIENNFYIGVSLDGPEDVHDRNRITHDGRPTFKRLMKSLAYIEQLNPTYYRHNIRFICVLNPPLNYQKLSSFFSTSKLTKDNEVLVSNVALFGQNYYTENDVIQFSKDSIKLIRDAAMKFYTSACKGTLSECTFEKGLFLKELRLLHSRDFKRGDREMDLLGRCIPGRLRRFLATDGTYYICEKMQGYYPIGNLQTGVDKGAVLSMIMQHEKLIEHKCCKCLYAKLCTLCYVAACGDHRVFSAQRLEENCIERRSFAKLLLRLYMSLRDALGDERFGALMIA